jgi:tRNA pseudouridine38-40 synthase
MNQAAKHLLGVQDFSSFAKAHTDVKTNICEVFEAEWFQTANGLYFEISANRFLRNMVRAIVGTLVEVGLGKIKRFLPTAFCAIWYAQLSGRSLRWV